MATESMRKKLLENSSLYDRDLLQNESDARFGAPNVPIFTTFNSRKECAESGVHTKVFAGISGSSLTGAYSICISSGYEDDIDNGNTLIYTGTGGQSNSFSGSGVQEEDQTFQHNDNAALQKSADTGRPVRVVRGPNPRSRFAPKSGYRYDGLYIVKKAYMGKGASGYAICKFDLERMPDQEGPIPVK